MERSQIYLIGGLIVVVIVIIALLMGGMGSSAGNLPSGYGQGQPVGQGAGYGGSAGAGSTVLPLQSDTTPLSETERADILYMREEEQMAHDLYVRWAGMYPVPVFSNIAQSETQHISQVQLLIDRYSLPGELMGNASAGYHNATIQSLYDSLALKGDASLTDAFEAGLAVEERDITDLDHALDGTTRGDIRQVYASLRLGSENHRNAFLRQLGR